MENFLTRLSRQARVSKGALLLTAKPMQLSNAQDAGQHEYAKKNLPPSSRGCNV
jgi:hypothetical protein